MMKIKLLLRTDAPIHNKKIEVCKLEEIKDEMLREWLNIAKVYSPSSIFILLDYGCTYTYKEQIPYWRLKDSSASYLRTMLNILLEKLETEHAKRLKILSEISKNKTRDMKVRNYLGY